LPLISSTIAVALNRCRPKRLKPEQQIAPLGLEYDRTKKLYRSAARRFPSSTAMLLASICAVTNMK
jgi:hypothetical protein